MGGLSREGSYGSSRCCQNSEGTDAHMQPKHVHTDVHNHSSFGVQDSGRDDQTMKERILKVLMAPTVKASTGKHRQTVRQIDRS